ncbi:hypothetical protein SAMN05444372_11831 [Flavobacterium micromati]|uniref:Uncharacterized protein n=1 Tax=Flavobacterium micromati TaxID=229205 RepID=A0A1M5QPP8_9FLAO|nr:hypothetical protein SAMN05444372_11831 [Flavobacterium micromati]
MNLSQVKKELRTLENVAFILPNGTFVPEHFHVTEVGLITKNFIDCGGKVRKETVVNFQLWDANDFDHRLKPKKLLDIIALSEKILGIENYNVEVEFQGETIGKYDLGFNGSAFTLINNKLHVWLKMNVALPQVNKK